MKKSALMWRRVPWCGGERPGVELAPCYGGESQGVENHGASEVVKCVLVWRRMPLARGG